MKKMKVVKMMANVKVRKTDKDEDDKNSELYNDDRRQDEADKS